MWTLESSWLAWMDHLENLAGAEVCEGPDYCRGYGDITIQEGIALGMKDTGLRRPWVEWVFQTVSNGGVDKGVRLGLLRLMAADNKNSAGCRCLKVLKENQDLTQQEKAILIARVQKLDRARRTDSFKGMLKRGT